MHVYMITNLIDGKQYIGAEKNGNNPDYFGSGKLIKEAIEKFGRENFKKEILIDENYIDSWKECRILESGCKLSFSTMFPNGYNKCFWEYPFSTEMNRNGGKIGGKRTKELGVGFFSSESDGIRRKNLENWRREHREEFLEHSSKGGKRTKELGVGFCALEAASRGGKRCKELGVGAHAPGAQSKGGKIGGKIVSKRCKELGLGFYDSKTQSEIAKRRAYTLFEIDGILQEVTLGALLIL